MPPLEPGTRVEVRRRFDQRWARGFEIAEAVQGDGYRLKRLSDGTVLPTSFDEDDVRLEKKKQGLWWA
ncbi:MAG: hypothetical protein H0W70_07200 [Actinobacteria bacterium]|nr:hypothetical protein [Actinomycetota bacterium]